MCCAAALDFVWLGFGAAFCGLFSGIDIHGMEFFFQSPLPLLGANRYYGQREDWRRCFEESCFGFSFVLFVLGSGIAI